METEKDTRQLEGNLRHIRRAERMSRVLMRRSGIVDGFVWPGDNHRRPPLPFHEGRSERGRCRVCGQPVWQGQRHVGGPDLKRFGTWHKVCLTAYFAWTQPWSIAAELLHAQGGCCAETGDAIAFGEVDHAFPPYRAAREHAGESWWNLIRFWSTANLRVLSIEAHARKSGVEAAERSVHAIRASHVGDLFA